MKILEFHKSEFGKNYVIDTTSVLRRKFYVHRHIIIIRIILQVTLVRIKMTRSHLEKLRL